MLPRKLTYPLLNASSDNSDEAFPLDVEQYPPDDLNDDEYKLIFIPVKAFEFLELATSIDVGMDIAYGSELWRVWSIWCRAMVFDCNLIIDCIETSPELQQVINYISNVGDSTSPVLESVLETVVATAEECDLDVLYGYCVALWDFINAQNLDYLQILAEAQNQSAIISEIFSAIPVLETLPIDEILGYADQALTWTVEAYEASITTEFNQSIYCEIFCLARDNNCSLDFGMVYQLFADRLSSPIGILSNFLDVMEFIITGSYEGDGLVYALSFVQLAAVIMGHEFLDMNTIAQYQIQAQIGNPDSDWLLICEECNEWVYEFDWLTSQDSWTYQTVNGANGASWSNGVGWSSVDINTGSGNYRRISAIQRAITATEITSIELTHNLTKGTITDPSANGLSMVVKVDTTDTRLDKMFSELSDVTGGTQLFNVNLENVIQIRLSVSSSYTQNNTFSGANKLVSVRITGEGDNPFV